MRRLPLAILAFTVCLTPLSLASASVDVTYMETPALDGVISAGEYAGATSIVFPTVGGSCTAYFAHDGGALYVAFDIPNADPLSGAQVFLDTEHDRATLPQVDDYRLTITITDDIFENQGEGDGWSSPGPVVGWTGAFVVGAGTWQAEFGIPFAKLAITTGVPKTIGICLINSWTDSSPYDYYWPAGAFYANPSTWDSASSSDNWGPQVATDGSTWSVIKSRYR